MMIDNAPDSKGLAQADAPPQRGLDLVRVAGLREPLGPRFDGVNR
jgi:hypothetical protein